jgi:hypothetical protein
MPKHVNAGSEQVKDRPRPSKVKTRKSGELKGVGAIYCGELSDIPATSEAIEKAANELSTKVTLRKFSRRQAERYLDLYKEGLTSWQFIKLAKLLASAKQRIGVRSRRRPRRAKTKQFGKAAKEK